MQISVHFLKTFSRYRLCVIDKSQWKFFFSKVLVFVKTYSFPEHVFSLFTLYLRSMYARKIYEFFLTFNFTRCTFMRRTIWPMTILIDSYRVCLTIAFMDSGYQRTFSCIFDFSLYLCSPNFEHLLW